MDALQQQIQELQQALNALQAQQAQQAGGQAPPPAAVFARAPAQLNHAALLNINGNLLTRQYGEISREQAHQAALVYQAQLGRDAQNSEILYNCLVASVNDDVTNTLSNATTARENLSSLDSLL